MQCKECGKECIRHGYTKSKQQRFFCKFCRKSRQEIYVYRACENLMDKEIVKLLINGCGIRSISRIQAIAIGTVMTRIRSIASKIENPIIVKGKEYEVDEMRTYVRNKKKKRWITYALDKITKEVVDFRIGRRSKKVMKPVIDTLLLSEASKIYTDGYALYSSLIPKNLHKKNKYKINHIERKNLSVRTHLKRLSRKTICYSKSISMLNACLRIYFWFSYSTFCKSTPG